MAKKKKNSVKIKNEVSTKPTNDANPIIRILTKATIITLIIAFFIYLSDLSGIFNPDYKNNHTIRKWNSFYDFSKDNNVDVLLVGNSHLYTGINPKNLSSALGCNAFILASPGTQVDDHYYVLKEAIEVSNPKLVVIETYGLKEVDSGIKRSSALSDQFKSFSARKNTRIKLESTPHLFSLSNQPYAWSNTLRNHSYIFNNYDQIKSNIDNKTSYERSDKDLYLGRYIRFQTGIEDDILQKYKDKGAPVNGEEYKTNDLQVFYTKKIIELCKNKNIEIVFLTLPMFEKHVKNYDAWKDNLSTTLSSTYSSNEYWIDMQAPPGYEGFSRHSFENTYSQNQHMTYSGSLLATYKLADFIQSKERIELPNRRNDEDWRTLFYKEEGFMENNTPNPNDAEHNVIYNSENDGGLKEILVLRKKDHNVVLVKYLPKSHDEYNKMKNFKFSLNVIIKTENSQNTNANIDVPLDIYHSTSRNMNFAQKIKSIDILKVNEAKIIPK